MKLKNLCLENINVDDEKIKSLESVLAGTLISRDNQNFEKARKVWNTQINKEPGLIIRCRDSSDVVETIKFGHSNELLVAVRGGGHNVSGTGTCDGGIVVDLSEMCGVFVDDVNNRVRVQGGAILADVDRETSLYGLVTPTGNVSETGIGGLTLGGGFSNLRRKFGLGIDNLTSVSMVLANGSVVRANEESHSDLFWAIRGGGGNFGVVTEFEFVTHKLPRDVYFAAQFFAMDQAKPCLSKWLDYVSRAPDEVSSLAFFWTVPDVSPFPPEIRGMKTFLYGALFAGDPAQAEEEFRELRNIGNPILDLSSVAPYTQWQSGFDPFFTSGAVYNEIRAYWKANYIRQPDSVFVDKIIDSANSRPTDQCLIALWQLGGAMSRIPDHATAFGDRSAPFMLSFDSCWTDPSLDALVTDWTREQLELYESYATGGSYLNFPGDGQNNEELVHQVYGDNYPRLSAIKTKYEPGNLFRVNQNIQPDLQYI